MISVYDIWFAQKAGNKIRECFALMGVDLDELTRETCHRWDRIHFTENFYHSVFFPKWKREAENYQPLLERIKTEDIQTVSIFQPEYPERLRQIFDPPFLLYYKGKLPEAGEGTAAVIGSRKATEYGRYVAYTIGRSLGSRGIHVISGLALGADTFAHRGALEGKGRTTAVLGSGVDICTPSSNRNLAERILEGDGCLLSEFPPGTPACPRNYPKRNRVISGLSQCVIVAEAAEKSGTSITAGLALEQGRDVYAVPGNITSPYSQGTNRLIKDGAIPLLSTEDLLEEMDFGSSDLLKNPFSMLKKESPFENRKKATRLLGKDELEIYETLEKEGELTFDQLCLQAKIPVSKMAGILTVLEMKGMIFKKRNKIMIAK